ncbi:MAG: T9SS type A sorting domain-containing protein [Flavobacteriales bacterium]|nr:T9SS type A sorting domain-containing protein [Flavobacteriales bacterium]
MRTSLHSRGLVTILLALFSLGAFRADAQVVQINTGAAAAPLYAVGPIYVSSTLFYRYSRYAYLYTQDELAAVGFTPGTTITTVGWMKSTANSAAGPALFSIFMKNSGTTAYALPTETWANLSSGATMVYTNAAQAIPATASPQYIDFALTAPFVYTGGSLEILTEWDISTAPTPIATGPFEWENTIVADRIYGMGNTALPATLNSTTNNTSIDDRRPVIQFTIDTSTGLRDLIDAMISVSPNPAQEFIRIRNEGATPVESMVITDAVGQVVFVEEQRGIRTDHVINVAGLKAGAYFLGIQTGAGCVVKRFTVW